MGKDIEIYDENGNHIGYGIENEFGGYEIHNDKNEWIGTSDECGIGNSREIYDHHNNHLGTIDDPELGATDFHRAQPRQSNMNQKTTSRKTGSVMSGADKLIYTLCCPVYVVVGIWAFYEMCVNYDTLFLIIGIVNLVGLVTTVNQLKKYG